MEGKNRANEKKTGLLHISHRVFHNLLKKRVESLWKTQRKYPPCVVRFFKN